MTFISLTSPPLADLWNHWDRCRGEELVPLFGSIRQEELNLVVGRMSILEIQSDTEIVFKFFGTDFVRAVGAELAGTNVLDSVHENSREALAQYLRTLSQVPCAGLFTLSSRLEAGLVMIVKGCHLPLRNNDGSINRLIGCSIEAGLAGVSTDAGRVEMGKSVFDFSYIDIGAGLP